MPELSAEEAALVRWLIPLVRQIPAAGSMTVTLSRDAQRRLRRASDVERRERHSWDDLDEQTKGLT